MWTYLIGSVNKSNYHCERIWLPVRTYITDSVNISSCPSKCFVLSVKMYLNASENVSNCYIVMGAAWLHNIARCQSTFFTLPFSKLVICCIAAFKTGTPCYLHKQEEHNYGAIISHTCSFCELSLLIFSIM